MDITPIDDALIQQGISHSASESAGILCGLACAKGLVLYDNWIATMMDENPETGSPISGQSAENSTLLQTLYHQTLSEMNDENFDFHLLLPDDDEPISVRAKALADWCQGFLYGLISGGVKDFDSLSGDAIEISRDFIEFSKMSFGDIEDSSETDEADYCELVEYVRMGVLLIYEELQPGHQKSPEEIVLH